MCKVCGVRLFDSELNLPLYVCNNCLKKIKVKSCPNCGNSHCSKDDYCPKCVDRGLTNPKVESYFACGGATCKKEREKLDIKNDKSYTCSFTISVRRVDKVVEDLCVKTFASKVSALFWLINNGFTKVEDSVFLYGNGANVFITKIRDN